MKLLRSGFLFTTVVVASIFSSRAQNSVPYSEVNIVSPTASSLHKFTDIPVNYHTGIPQISIPVYTVKEGPLSLAVSLSYHAGGVKVMEPAGWVGTGWSLQAGGVISRTVRGAPDEAGNTGIGQFGHFTHYGYSNYMLIDGSAWAQSNYTTIPNDEGFELGEFDGEPDLFFFNFDGYSGKFFFSDDRTPVIVDGEDLKIEYYFPRDTEPSYNALTANIQGFLVTVPNGTKYYFGKMPGGGTAGSEPVEITFPYSHGQTVPADRVYSSWYLRRIESADAMFSINFTYQAEVYSYYTISMFPIDGTWMPQLNNYSNSEYKLVKNYTEGVRLSQISFSNGTIDFVVQSTPRTDLGNNFINALDFEDNANTEAKALETISINATNGFCKQYKFYYSYFSNSASPSNLQGYLNQYTIQTDRYRLKLDSLAEQTCDNSLRNPAYKFQYYSDFLPRRLSFAQDHWGYYNGANGNSMLLPTYSINTYTFVDGANRDSKWPEMQHGALTKITYPTGGSTTYEFEGHTTYISATRHTPEFRYSFSVGYDGNNSATYTNKSFSGNHYKVTLSNNTCPPNTSGCAAGVNIINSSNTVIATVGANGNETNTSIIEIPAGAYTITMSRNATQTGTGASVTFTEIVPSVLQGNELVGGLRVKTITQHDNINSDNNIVTNFSYVSNSQSTGVLYSRPAYLQIVRNDLISMFGLSPQAGSATVNVTPNGCLGPEITGNNQKYYKSPCGILPMASTNGNHIGYNEVKVSKNGNGHTIYRYYGSNLWDNLHDDVAYRNVTPAICSSSIPVSPAAPLSYEYKRGELKYEGYFNQAGQVLKDVQYSYDFDSSSYTTPAYMIKSVLGARLGNRYELRGYWKKRTQTITTDHVPGVSALAVTNTIYNESPYHHMASRVETTDSKGDLKTQKIKYAFDFRLADCDAIPNGMTAFTADCNSCDVAFIAQNNNCSTLSCFYWAWINNFMCKAEARKTLITTRRNNFTNTVNAYKTCLTNYAAQAGVNFKPILELHKVFNNAPIESSTWKNTNLLNAAFTSYDFSQNPSSKVYPSKINLVQLSVPAASFTYSTNSNTAVSIDNRYTGESAVKFDLGNISSITKKENEVIAYVWDYNNTLPVAKVVNAGESNFAYSSFEADGSGNWSIVSTARITDGVTGNKCYQLSGGSISRSGLTSSMEYVLTVWVKAGASVNVSNSIGSPVQGRSVGQWTCFVFKIGNATQVTISGSGLLDELRLHPKTAQMNTYTYRPLVGITEECDISNRIIYYEYDSFGRLKLIRDQDKNILKKFEYQHQTFIHNNSVWIESGNTRCKPCTANSEYSTNMLQNEEKDTNPNSSTYDQLRWVDAGTSSNCVINADWQFTTTAIRCKQAGGENTGEQEREQKDMNPCSQTYNTLRWVVTGINTSECPMSYVYARISLTNPGGGTSDVVVAFFEDAACTMPVSVSNLVVNWQEEEYNDLQGTSTYNSYSTTCNGTETVLAYGVALYGPGPGQAILYRYYSLLSGTGYAPTN